MSRRSVSWAFLLASAASVAAAPAFTTRTQVEQLLARDLASGTSPAGVASFLDAHGIAHGEAQAAGPARQLTASVPGLRNGASRFTLELHFSFLQDRLIGYSFNELPVSGR